MKTLTTLVSLSIAFTMLGACSGNLDIGGGDAGTDAAQSEGGSPTDACTEFQVGGSVDPNIGGSIASRVAAQSVADFAGTAATGIDAITTSCRTIAKDLGAPSTDQDAAEATANKRDRMTAWCQLAAGAIGVAKTSAGGTLKIQATPVTCGLLVGTKTTCQGVCAGGACDGKANPTKCTGGRIMISCNGDCSASVASPSVRCQGACDGRCDGSCASPSGVECVGACIGKCGASAMGDGPQSDGTCKGTCKGTCTATAPGATCNGTCGGDCSGTCQGTTAAPVRCDGKCSGDFDPFVCEGGRLEGGCKVDAGCDRSCDVSVVAKAECPNANVGVAVAGATNTAAATTLQGTLPSNLGVLLAYQARLRIMIPEATGWNASSVSDIKAACVPVVVSAMSNASADVTAGTSSVAAVLGASGL